MRTSRFLLLGAAVSLALVTSAQSSEEPDAARPEPVPADQLPLLEDALSRYRKVADRGGWKKVPTDLVMGEGYSYDCARIAVMERRLVSEGYLDRMSTPPPPPRLTPEQAKAAAKSRQPKPMPTQHGGDCRYTSALTEAVQKFQADRKILGKGQIGSQTMAALNRPIDDIVRTLEHDVARWRKISTDPSGTYLLVNIPFYELIAYHRGREALRMPVIVGKTDWQTPQFNDELEYIIVNPDWGIPETIARLEYWPLAKRDPKYLSRQGISASGGSLRQKPGPNNPLGRIKFVMPNPHDVYLHDTPYKRAFEAAVKALSHGCVRVSRPMDLGRYLLEDDPQWSPQRLEAAVASGRTQQINLARHMPVHIVYSTSRVNAEGRLELRPDVYGKNRGAVAIEEEARPPSDDGYYRGP